MAERDLVEKVKAELKRRGAYRVKTTPPGVEKGTPDILACYHGWFLGLELKEPGKHRDPMQSQRALEIERAGGFAFEIHTMEELRECLGAVDRASDPGSRNLCG